MKSSVTTRVSCVKTKLLSQHSIIVKNDWIEDCVIFFLSQAPDLDEKTLYHQALQQFLLADMNEACGPTFPSALFQSKGISTLNKTFVVQLLAIIDIARP
jgi:RecQ mediated genome instability protein